MIKDLYLPPTDYSTCYSLLLPQIKLLTYIELLTPATNKTTYINRTTHACLLPTTQAVAHLLLMQVTKLLTTYLRTYLLTTQHLHIPPTYPTYLHTTKDFHDIPPTYLPTHLFTTQTPLYTTYHLLPTYLPTCIITPPPPPPHHFQNEQGVLTSSCNCICKPCPEGMRLCPSINYCLNETSWCNGVVECPEDELECPSTTPGNCWG